MTRQELIKQATQLRDAIAALPNENYWHRQALGHANHTVRCLETAEGEAAIAAKANDELQASLAKLKATAPVKTDATGLGVQQPPKSKPTSEEPPTK